MLTDAPQFPTYRICGAAGGVGVVELELHPLKARANAKTITTLRFKIQTLHSKTIEKPGSL
jgi:hypothetical protein